MELTDTIKEFISIPFVIINMSIIYCIIWFIEQCIKEKNRNKDFKTVYKKITTAIISIIIGLIFINKLDKDIETIVTSALLSIIFYDYIVKYAIVGIKKWSHNKD